MTEYRNLHMPARPNDKSTSMFRLFDGSPDPIDGKIGELGMARMVFRGSDEDAWKTEYRTRANFTTTLFDDHGFVVPPAHQNADGLHAVEPNRTYKMGIRCYDHSGFPLSLRWDKAFIMYGFVGDDFYVPVPQLARSGYTLDTETTIEVSVTSRTEQDDDASFVTERAASSIRDEAPFDVTDDDSRIAPLYPSVTPPKQQNDADRQRDSGTALPPREDLHVIIAAWLQDDASNLREYAHVVDGYPTVEDVLLAVDAPDDVVGVEVGETTLDEQDAAAIKQLLDQERTLAEIVHALEGERQ